LAFNCFFVFLILLEAAVRATYSMTAALTTTIYVDWTKIKSIEHLQEGKASEAVVSLGFLAAAVAFCL